MSAVSWDEVALAGEAGSASDLRGMSSGRHLRLVPAGPDLETEARPLPLALALTRRGRLALLALTVVLALGAAVVGVRAATATTLGPAESSPAIAATVTVRSGETLSQIAARELPSLSIREGIARIQIANNLSTTAISAGEALAIPKV